MTGHFIHLIVVTLVPLLIYFTKLLHTTFCRLNLLYINNRTTTVAATKMFSSKIMGLMQG